MMNIKHVFQLSKAAHEELLLSIIILSVTLIRSLYKADMFFFYTWIKSFPTSSYKLDLFNEETKWQLFLCN